MAPWQLSADGSNDEMFLSAQESAGVNQNSQGKKDILIYMTFTFETQQVFLFTPPSVPVKKNSENIICCEFTY